MAKYIVTVTPPTPNGDLHIGHLSGPFLGADVFTRAQRQRGHECILVSYSDDYQSYMLRRGMELGIEPFDLAARNTDLIKRSLAAVDIRFDNWMSAQNNPFFRAAVEEVFNAARDAGALVWKTTREPYCRHCRVWGYEAFGRGLCNFCGHDSDASQCEECAQAPDAAKMENFHCKLCSRPHDWQPVDRWFLKLGEYKSFLRTLHRRFPTRAPLDTWVEGVVDTLEDWGITRPEDGGLDLLPDGSCRLHTWFMGLSGYLAAVREFAAQSGQPDLPDRFLTDPKARFYHFLGYDCAFSHMLVYPTLLSTLPSSRIGQRFIPNLFLKLDGLNLSTSRGHAIWVAEFAQRAPSDSIRLYLARVAPEQEGGDFWSTEYEAWREDVFGALIPEILEAGRRMSGTGAVRLPESADPEIVALAARLEQCADPETFTMKGMAGVVEDALRQTAARRDTPSAMAAMALFLAWAGQPLVPRLSAEIVEAFGFDDRTWQSAVGRWTAELYLAQPAQ